MDFRGKCVIAPVLKTWVMAFNITDISGIFFILGCFIVLLEIRGNCDIIITTDDYV